MKNISSASEYWDQIVLPDYRDYMADKGSVRRAFHLSSSLFHMADWVYYTYMTSINGKYRFIDQNGGSVKVSKQGDFHAYLATSNQDFSLMRDIANCAKHSQISGTFQSVTGAPKFAANVAISMTMIVVTSGALGDSCIGGGPICGGDLGPDFRIKLEGTPLFFDNLATSVRDFWISIRQSEQWLN